MADQTKSQKSKEQLETEWWDAWWREDWSWDGLAKKPWDGWSILADGSVSERTDDGVMPPGARFATLQDYWRDQEGDLVEAPNGSRFTRVHLPIICRDGKKTGREEMTGKEEWTLDALDAIICAKLSIASENRLVGGSNDRRIVGGDRRAQFQGAALLRSTRHPLGPKSSISARFDRCSFLHDADFVVAAFCDGALFRDTCFFGHANFDNSTFSGGASFDNSIFLGEANFVIAIFSDGTSFDHVTFSDLTSFDGAIFSSTVIFFAASCLRSTSFDGANFSAYAGFDGATFAQDVSFDAATFSAKATFDRVSTSEGTNFRGATFSLEGSFRRANLANTTFEKASFSKGAAFESAHLIGNTRFNGTIFSDNASFDDAAFTAYADFTDVTFTAIAALNRATFAGYANFGGVKFFGYAEFRSVKFEKEASFHSVSDSAVFGRLADFTDALFVGMARFSGVEFQSGLSFSKSRFTRIADFANVVFPESERDWREAFNGALFESSLDISNDAPLKHVSMVSGATFDRGVLLSRHSENQDKKAHAEALAAAEKAEDKQAALRALQDGALKLKKAMAEASDTEREQRFFRLELSARRKQKGVHWTEWFFSQAYRVIAGYGASIGRPMVFLALSIFVSAAAYWGIENWNVRSPAAGVEALRFSLSRVFPLGTWGESDDALRVAPAAKTQPDCSFRERLMAQDECRPSWAAPGMMPKGNVWLEVYRTTVALLSTLQTIFAAAIYFLFALAVRRKFQIS